jgi:hypothetical protein
MRRIRLSSLLSLALGLFVFWNPFRLAAEVLLNEFMAANATTLADEDGDYPDWIEVHNSGVEAVDLGAWSLTTKPGVGREKRWSFPSTNLPAGDFMVIFASGKDRRAAGSPLHTDFKLSRNGEPLLLLDPLERPALGSFSVPFPPQPDEVSYGLGRSSTDEVLLEVGDTHFSLVPTDASVEREWMQPGFATSGWEAGVGGIGYETREPGELTLHPLIADNVRSRLYARNPGLYLRVPFVVRDPQAVEEMSLQLWHTDGFVAWVNGMEVLSAFRPSDLRWNSVSEGSRDPAEALRPALVELGEEAKL